MVQENTENTKFEETIGKHPQGIGFRPSFLALWHLEKLGVVSDLSNLSFDNWKNVKDEPVRVVVLDTPVAYKHPNLRGVIDCGLMRDFSVFDDGVFVVAKSDLDSANLYTRDALVNSVSDVKSMLADTIRKENDDGNYRRQFSPTSFGTHGTAVAGLIGARPTEVTLCKPAFLGGGDKYDEFSDKNRTGLPYCGINPFCSIIPISMTAAPFSKMVKGALDYVLLVDPDIVVIAAAWAEQADRDRDQTGWQEVDSILAELCKKSIVLCAAGNQDTDQLVYPANKSEKEIGPWAVTACDADGNKLSYAPPIDKQRRMIKTLSSEFPRYDRNTKLFDPWEKRDPERGLPMGDPTTYPVQEIISLDVPGPTGYNPSPFQHTPSGDCDEKHFEIGSLFCRFSGSSAATAVAAGLASLVLQQKQLSDNDTIVEPDKETDEEVRCRLLDIKAARRIFLKPE